MLETKLRSLNEPDRQRIVDLWNSRKQEMLRCCGMVRASIEHELDREKEIFFKKSIDRLKNLATVTQTHIKCYIIVTGPMIITESFIAESI